MKTKNHHLVPLALALAALALNLSVIHEAKAASWTTTGPLITARWAHTATLLPNGKVLAAGGNDTTGDTNAELYDPATGTWTSAGTMTSSRSLNTATLLTNGLVLVAGGFYGNNSAELYNPATGTWTATGTMTTGRSQHTATLLPNGKVLVVAGLDSNLNPLSSAELYDPATGKWTVTNPLGTPTSEHTATLLPNGKVLVAGASGTGKVAKLYDPATGTWTATGSLATGRDGHTATLLPNGKVLVAAGYDINENALSSAELYDPATGKWTATNSLTTARYYQTATLLPNGKVLVAAGDAAGTSAELYDPATGTWTATGPLAGARYSHTATLLPNGKVLVAAGANGYNNWLSSAELYDSANGTWANTGSLNTAREYHTATLLPNGKVLAAAGQGSSGGSVSGAELFNPSTGTWAATNSLTTARQLHTATLLPNGKVLAAGGNGSSGALSSAELFDPSGGTWTATSPMTTARWLHKATLLPYGKVLVSGGQGSSGVLYSVELYDPVSQTWAAAGRLTTARCYHTATLLPNGKVLVAGGNGSSGVLSSAELYNPASGTWANTSSMTTARFHHTATLLPNGKVLVAGGNASSAALSSAELYDPASGTWTASRSMTTAREFHAATLLPNGKVLVSGGLGSGSSKLSSTELYDPATGTWLATGVLNTARELHTATLLPNGKVLVAGGQGSSGYLSSAELYDVGLGFSTSWQPQITTFTSPLSIGYSLMITGSQFRGISEGSGGNGSQDSPADYPVVQLESLGNEQTLFLVSTAWQTNSFTSGPMSGLPTGYAMARVFVNGIPSTASLLNINVAPIPYSVATSGAIGVAGKYDEWTFFGWGGRGVAIVVNPGSTGTTHPNPPYLGLAQATVFDPSGVILGAASNTVSGQVVVWQNHSLPSDGIYRVDISGAYPTNTGNYVVTLWDSPATVASVLLNQQVFGSIATPYSVNQWNFSAAAGQQIQFHLVNVSGSGVAFDLTGPGSWTGFSSITNDSGPVTLPSSGAYTLTAHSAAGQYGISYAFQLIQTTMTDLPLGTPYHGTLAGSGYAQLFRVTTTVGQPLLIQMNDPSSSDRNELYAKLGSAPTRSDYDYRFSGASAPNQQLLIPSAPAGTWYILVYGGYVPSAGPFTITAASAALFATAVTPGHLDAGSAPVFTLTGAGFVPGTIVELVDGGGNVFAAQSTTIDSYTEITATFATGSLPAGSYTAEVQIPGQPPQPLSGVITVNSGGTPHLVANLIVPSVMGYHELATLYVQYSNSGNAAMPAPLLFLHITQDGKGVNEGAFLTLQQTDLSKGFWTSATPAGFNHSIQLLAGGALPGVLQPGESFTVPVYYAGWQQPWDLSHPPFQANLGVLAADNTDTMDWASLKAGMRPASISTDAWEAIWANFTNQVGNTWGAYDQMLDDNAAYLNRLGQRVVDVGQLLAFEVQQADGLSPIGALASAVDTTMQAPGLSLSFNRVFPEPISQRYQLGPLGRGWSHNWQMSLSVASDGTATIAGPAGSLRVFQPDSRHAGAYFSQAGDYGTLTKLSGGAFSLQEKNGLLYAFRSDGNLNYVQDTNGNRITCAYSGTQLNDLTHSSGQSLTLAYNAAGRIATITDSLSRQTTYTYDGSGEHLLSVVTCDGRTNNYAYLTGQGIGKEHALSQIGYASGSHRYFTYDGQGRLASTYRDGNAETVTFSYDSAGTVTATDALGGASEFCFDYRGLLAKTEDALGNVVFMSFDDNYNLTEITDPAGRSFSYEYDANGNLVRSTDALGNITQFSYTNVFNGLASVTDAKSNTTQYACDAKGNLTLITYANNSRETWGYDSLGNPTAWTNRRGNPINSTYDANGRITRKTYQDSSHVDYTYDAHGNLIQTVDASGTNIFTYSATDYLTRIAYPGGHWLQFTYDSAGRASTILDQTGHQVIYAYDAAGRLQSLTNELGEAIMQYQYGAAGRLIREARANGTFSTLCYDSAGNVLGITNSAPDDSVQSFFDYIYDAKGNRLSMTTTAGVTTYAYDDLNQLTGVVYPSGRHVTYAYNALGNRTAVNDNGTNTIYAANALNAYTNVAGTTLQYDLDGNLIVWTDARGVTTNQYDSENRLISVNSPTTGTWQNIYDALGNRIASVHNGVTNCFVINPFGGYVAAEYDSTGALVTRYDYGLGLVARTDGAGNEAFYAFDALGNTRQLTQTGGAVINSYDYDAFGAATLTSETVSNEFRFVGQFGIADEPTGLLFMRARYYDPEPGQFVSNDPIGLDGGDVNLYRYVGNNPIVYFDSSGLTSLGPYTILKFDNDGNFYPAGLDIRHILPKHDPPQPPVDPKNDPMKWIPHNPVPQAHRPPDPRPSHDPPPSTPPRPNKPKPPLACDCQYYPSPNINSHDPNEKIGPSGFGTNGYIPDGGVLPYRIEFENSTNATAPAQIVQVTDQLSTNLDWSTFQLSEIGFGDVLLAIPPGSQYYEDSVPMTYSGVSFEVQLNAGIDFAAGQVYANFYSIDPATGLPPGVSIGFLPPEDGTGRGIGHVSYTLQAKAGLPTGTQIRNVADIVFDEGQIISTDQIDDSNPAAGVDLSKQCLLTIDAVAPTSTVASLPPTVSSNCFTVSWSGTDDPGGSGLAFWDIYASRDGAPFQLWLYETTNSSALFQGEPGVHYGFFSVATDEVGNVEATPSGAQAQTVTTFRLTRAALAGTAPKMLVVNWESATNKLYDVWQSTNLSKGFTLQVATNVPATPPINLFSNSLSASGPLFLRVVGKP